MNTHILLRFFKRSTLLLKLKAVSHENKSNTNAMLVIALESGNEPIKITSETK